MEKFVNLYKQVDLQLLLGYEGSPTKIRDFKGQNIIELFGICVTYMVWVSYCWKVYCIF